MDRYIGRSAYGIRLPLKIDLDNLQEEIVKNLLKASESNKSGFYIPKSGGIIGITESIVARSQKNYVTKKSIADDLESKLMPGNLVIMFPILSRNRFLPILQAISLIDRKITIVLQALTDEVGNPLAPGVLFWKENEPLTDDDFKRKYGDTVHPYTKINYIDLYKSVKSNIDIKITDNPYHAGLYGENILVCTTHNRFAYKRFLEESYPNKNILTLSDICNTVKDNEGYNQEYGLLGANLSDSVKIKLFPRNCTQYVKEVQKKIYDKTGKIVEVLIFGDGAYKDPVQQIWELADPVTCPGYTDGLAGTPDEIKLKYLLDTYKGDEVDRDMEAVVNKAHKEEDRLGTTPRHIVDIVASLCDLITGSGDTGTPVVYINGFFDKFFDGFPSEK